MDEQEERALVLGALGARTARGVGVRLASRWFRWDIIERRLEVAGDLDVVRERAAQALEKLGVRVEAPEGDIAAIVGAGVAKLNPALVTLRFGPAATGGRTTVTVRGVAAEGLIKQHAGRRALDQVAEQLKPGT